VVLGSSLAGLFAAVALARHVDTVTIVERDRLPEGPEWRRGVPQARHAHNLMTAGHRAMEELLPGIYRELVDAGMVEVSMSADLLLLSAGGWMPRFSTGLVMLTGSRDVIDWAVRQRVRADPRISLLTETEAIGLVGDERDGDTVVRGVAVRPRDPAAPGGWGDERTIHADFVIDATGRTSRAPEWLRALGFRPPAETVVDAQTAYSTCVFDPPAGHAADWKCLLLQYSPQKPVQGILNPIEHGRWMVSLAALGGRQPPADSEGFLAFARDLRSPVLYDVLRDARPVTPIHRSGRTENRRRHYEKLRRWPDRFLVLGDAAGALNPSYGQGMSVAACSALAVEAALSSAGSLEGIASGLRRDVARCINLAWSISATADLAYPWAADGAGLATRMLLRYLYRVIAASPTSRAASRAMLDINQMVAPPQAVLRPRVLAAAIRGTRRPPVAGAPPAPSGASSHQSLGSSLAGEQGTASAQMTPGTDAAVTWRNRP